jgi:hypothetical protein
MLGNMSQKSQIFECATILELAQYVNADTCLLYDLDNTIFQFDHTLGTDQWFEFFMQQKRQEGYTPEEARVAAVQVYLPIASTITEVSSAEETTIPTIKALQALAQESIALTSRGTYLLDPTNRQLEYLGLSFNKGILKDQCFDIHDGLDSGVRNGKILVGGKDKGQCLIEVFQKMDYFPKRVVFIDDKRGNLDSVERALAALAPEREIEFIGLRYNVLDAQVKQLNEAIAQIQLQYFNQVLPDWAAGVLLKYDPANRNQKAELKVDVDPGIRKATIVGNRAAVYRKLLAIAPELAEHEYPGAIIHFNGKEKWGWQFEVELDYFSKILRSKLQDHNLLTNVAFSELDVHVKQPAVFHAYLMAQQQQAGYRKATSGVSSSVVDGLCSDVSKSSIKYN